MAKKIIIVRHGQTSYNKQRIIQGQLDIMLDETGMKQAEDVAVVLAGEEVDVIFSSDLKRAMHTAHPTAKRLNKAIIPTPLLRERYFGKLQGKTHEEIRKVVDHFGEQGSFALHGREHEFGVETDEAMFKRLDEFKKMMQEYEDKTVLIFTHGGLIRLLLRAFGVPKEQIDKLEFRNAEPMVLKKNGSAYRLY